MKPRLFFRLFSLPFLIIFLFIPITLFATGDIPANMVLIKGGTFMMGDSCGDGDSDERPVHKIKVNSFLIGKYEVNQKEWQEIMGKNPTYFKADDRLPVDEVNWYDCIEFCIKKSRREGLKPYYTLDKNKRDPENVYDTDLFKWLVKTNPKADGYRLPTEAEWEFAARGGRKSKGTKYSGSNHPAEVAWYTDNSGLKTHPVGTKKPNELGIYDMSGNVWEWCWDWYDRYPFNFDINFSYGKRSRVLRGGSYGGFEADDIRCSSRWGDDPDSWEAFFGLRVCRSIVK